MKAAGKVAGKVSSNSQATDSVRRALHDEPTLYEAQHAASAFGLSLLSPEPIEDRANPWEEATHVPPLPSQRTQALPQLGYGPTAHAEPIATHVTTAPRLAVGQVAGPSAGHGAILLPEPISAVTEVRQIPHPGPSSSPPSARQRLYYPFLVGTIGGLCGLLLAMVGLRIIKQQRDRAEQSRVEQRVAREQLLEQAVRALVMGRHQEARTLLFDFNHRWPTPEIEKMLRTLEQIDPKDRRESQRLPPPR